jgi:hypothetical protein
MVNIKGLLKKARSKITTGIKSAYTSYKESQTPERQLERLQKQAAVEEQKAKIEEQRARISKFRAVSQPARPQQFGVPGTISTGAFGTPKPPRLLEPTPRYSGFSNPLHPMSSFRNPLAPRVPHTAAPHAKILVARRNKRTSSRKLPRTIKVGGKTYLLKR